MPPLLDALAAELERPREVTPQVTNHLVGTYGLARDGIAAFLVTELPGLEDYEIDLMLSPMFTPTLHDQAVFAELLGRDMIPQAQWPGLVEQLVIRPTRAQLLTGDGQAHSVPLRAVTIERYLHRLRLDATIGEPLFKLINHLPPVADRALLKAVTRRAVWQNDARLQILVHYLTTAASRGDYRLDDAVALLRLVETYLPTDSSHLRELIPHWQQVLRQEINEAASPKPFFNERVQDLHGGGRDQRKQDNSRIKTKEDEQAFLERLQAILAA